MEYALENKFFHAAASIEATEIDVLTRLVQSLAGGTDG